jgi:predicted NBD/HSP70 family sugar kinase
MSAPISLGIDFGGTSIKPGVVQDGRIIARGNVIPTRQATRKNRRQQGR